MEKEENFCVNPERVKEAEALWEDWDEERRLALYRKAAETGGVDADLILHPMAEFDAVLAGTPPIEIARMVLEGDFDLWSEYFYIDCAKNLVSVCSADLPDFLELVSDDVIRYMAMHQEVSVGERTKI